MQFHKPRILMCECNSLLVVSALITWNSNDLYQIDIMTFQRYYCTMYIQSFFLQSIWLHDIIAIKTQVYGYDICSTGYILINSYCCSTLMDFDDHILFQLIVPDSPQNLVAHLHPHKEVWLVDWIQNSYLVPF